MEKKSQAHCNCHAESVSKEEAGMPVAAGQGDEPGGQKVELKFRAPRAGKYDLTLYVLSGGPLMSDFIFFHLRECCKILFSEH